LEAADRVQASGHPALDLSADVLVRATQLETRRRARTEDNLSVEMAWKSRRRGH
jgi:outer membrane biosynthesis protein TonB